jgi:hypothetical protein
MFFGWQLAGLLAAMSTRPPGFVLMLLPGSFIAIYFFRFLRAGNYWPKWMPFAIAVGINLILFTITAMLIRKRAAQIPK